MELVDIQKPTELNDVLLLYQSNDHDRSVAVRLYKMLRRYRAPRHINSASKHMSIIKYESCETRDTFNSDADLPKMLLSTRYLIILCSPGVTLSDRIKDIISDFYRMHNGNILLLVTMGRPEEYISILLPQMKDPLVGNIASNSLKESLKRLKTEKLRLIAPILGLGFDDLKQRQRERIIQKLVGLFSGMIAVVTILGGISLYEWKQTEKATNQANEATKTAVRNTNIANNQFEVSKKAFHNLYINVPAIFEDMPDASDLVRSSLAEATDELKSMKGYEEILNKLIDND
jgi:hypothetical protein